jgi:DNA polymerase-3 subunit beta
VNLTITPKQLRRLSFGKHLPFVDVRPHRKGARLTTAMLHSVSVVVEGTDVVPMRLAFPDVVRAAKIGKGTFALANSVCTAGGFTFPMKALAAVEELPRPTKVRLRMSDADITTVLTRVANVMSKDVTRPHLACLHVARKGGVLAFTATDGHRMHRATFPSSGKDFVALLPADAVRSLATMTGDLVLRADDPSAKQRVLLRRGREWVQCLAVDAMFPKSDQIIPALPMPYSFTVDAGAVRGVVTTLAKYATRNSVCAVRMELRDGLRLSCESWDSGKDGPCRMVGPVLAADGTMPLKVGVNSTYLLGALPPSGDVTLHFSDELDPFRVEGGVLALVMPMRI